jgi:hypothetical protein
MRKTLSLKSAAPAETSAPSHPAIGIIEAAMLRKLRVRAIYNRTEMQFAPHILYTRHDDPFVDGVVMEREGKPPREIKLASFKLAGLSGLTLTTERFQPQPVFDPAEPRYEGVQLAMVKLDAPAQAAG